MFSQERRGYRNFSAGPLLSLAGRRVESKLTVKATTACMHVPILMTRPAPVKKGLPPTEL
jgi:hypothetical protein